MTTKSITLKSDINILSKIAKFLNLFASDKDLFITVSDDKAKIRSNAQNALIHVYYAAISEKTGYEVDDCEARCKRRFGLPIMQVQKGESTKKGKHVFTELLRFGLITDANEVEQKRVLIRYYDLIEEGQVECFKSIEVTRNFNSTQMKQYIESIERYWAQHGLVLESINEQKRRDAFG